MSRDMDFSGRSKQAIWENADGRCEGCGRSLKPGERHRFNHVVPVYFGGSNQPDNGELLCEGCDFSKRTYKTDDQRLPDLSAIAKSKRIRAKRIGADEKRGRALPGTRRSGWRKRMDGTVERR